MTPLYLSFQKIFDGLHQSKTCPICNNIINYYNKSFEGECNKCPYDISKYKLFAYNYHVYLDMDYNIIFSNISNDKIILNTNLSFNSLSELVNHLDKLTIFQ